MKMPELKKASLEELETLVTLFDRYRVFYNYPSDVEGAKQFLYERISNKESEIILCITEQNMMAGFVQLYPLFSSTRMKRLWLLNDLFVQEEHRGKGYSVLLIEAAKVHCRNTAGCGLILETASDNVIANRLYLKTGFELDNEHHYYSWTPVHSNNINEKK